MAAAYDVIAHTGKMWCLAPITVSQSHAFRKPCSLAEGSPSVSYPPPRLCTPSRRRIHSTESHLYSFATASSISSKVSFDPPERLTQSWNGFADRFPNSKWWYTRSITAFPESTSAGTRFVPFSNPTRSTILIWPSRSSAKCFPSSVRAFDFPVPGPDARITWVMSCLSSSPSSTASATGSRGSCPAWP